MEVRRTANLSSVAEYRKFFIVLRNCIFLRSLTPLARRAQRSLEAETLQKVAQDRVDPQKIVAAQNELRSFTQCSLKHQSSGPGADVAACALSPNYSLS